MAHRFCEWITITAPQDIHVLSTSHGQAWLNTLSALWGRHELEGHKKTYWTRVLEDPEQLWIWTSWESQDTYETQMSSPQAMLAQARLAELSTTAPMTRLIEFNSAWDYSIPFYKNWPSVTLCYLPLDVSDESRNKIGKIRGMRPVSGNYKDPPTGGRASRGSVRYASKTSAQEDVYMFLDYWHSPIYEEEVRKEKRLITETETKTLSEIFEDDLKEAGVVKKEVWHVRFKQVLKLLFPEDAVRGNDVNFDWEQGRKDREELKKVLPQMKLIR